MPPGVMMARDEAMSCATFTGGQADRRIGGSSDSRNMECTSMAILPTMRTPKDVS